MEQELPLLLVEYIQPGDIRRQQIRRELDSVKLRVYGPGQGFRHLRLPRAGHILQKHMPARNHRSHKIFDNPLFTHDDCGNIFLYIRYNILTFLLIHTLPRFPAAINLRLYAQFPADAVRFADRIRRFIMSIAIITRICKNVKKESRSWDSPPAAGRFSDIIPFRRSAFLPGGLT